MAKQDLDAELWQEQARWSAAANQMKRRIERSRSLALTIMILVAILGESSATIAPISQTTGKILAATAAVGAALLPLLRSRWSGAALRDWTRARSMSETLKSQVYLWLAGADADSRERDSGQLRKTLNELRTNVVDLLPEVDGVMATPRPLPAVHDAQSYFAIRVTEQVESFYRPRARQLTRRLRVFDRATLVLAILGALLGGVAALGPLGLASWLPVLTTIATAIATHVAATRYRFQRLEYLRTAERLSQLRDEAEMTATPRRLTELVLAAEAVVTAENQVWMTKFVSEDPAVQSGSLPGGQQLT